MAEKVTAASAIKAVQDFASSLTKEDWERLEKIHQMDAITCSAYMYPDRSAYGRSVEKALTTKAGGRVG